MLLGCDPALLKPLSVGWIQKQSVEGVCSYLALHNLCFQVKQACEPRESILAFSYITVVK